MPVHLPVQRELLPQPKEAIQLAADAKRGAEHLRMHGIRTAEPQVETALLRRYVIPVAELDALAVYTTAGTGGVLRAVSRRQLVSRLQLLEPSCRPAAVRRAETAAVRAVYALGLRWGVVMLGSAQDGQPAVEAVDASPPQGWEPYAPLYAEAAQRAMSGERNDGKTGPLMLGMDPEFVLRRPGNGGKIVFASRFFERRGVVGCDSVRIGGQLMFPLAELRPPPAAEPRELFRNLHQAMRIAASRIDDASLEWLAGGMPAKGLPLGGHIHVSGVKLNADLLRAMDNYMALPLVLIEDSTTRRRRPRYGALGDFRRQPHGGFEYRTLPSWIVTPHIALGVIALAKVVCEHYRELRERPLARPAVQAHYYAGRKEVLRPYVLKLWQQLELTETYQRYAKELRPLKRAVLRMEAWNEQQDIRIPWKIIPQGV